MTSALSVQVGNSPGRCPVSICKVTMSEPCIPLEYIRLPGYISFLICLTAMVRPSAKTWPSPWRNLAFVDGMGFSFIHAGCGLPCVCTVTFSGEVALRPCLPHHCSGVGLGNAHLPLLCHLSAALVPLRAELGLEMWFRDREVFKNVS